MCPVRFIVDCLYKNLYIYPMKKIVFLRTSREDILAFPEQAKRKAGHELMAVQMGVTPLDWKPMASIGKGVKEIRIHTAGEFRILYVARFKEAVYVLHAFQKKSNKTPGKDIDLARKRLKQLLEERNCLP
jgi:phage-related protein